MGIDADLVSILEDLVKFLETLSGVDLPNDLPNVRDNLLRRSKTSLNAVGQHSTTPEPYLDMNAGKGKGLHLIKTIDSNNINNENQITEYMYADNSNESKLSSCQDYYEPFVANISINSNENVIKREYDDAEEELKQIYRTFSSEQTISKATKSGPLHLKEERRFFGLQIFSGFDQFRSCFIGLVGTHLLLYTTKYDKHPSDIISIRGYSARASPNSIPRDLERSKSAFEMFSPGNKTFQFAARSPKDMEQWVAVICRAGNAISSSIMPNPIITRDTLTNSVISADSTCSEEQYQDGGCMNDKQRKSEKIIDTDTNNDHSNEITLRNEQKSKSSIVTTMTTSTTDRILNPPLLPARIPRRLPSLPHEHSSSNFDIIDDGYDEDDIYHKIEDFKQPSNTNTYQNLSNTNHTLNTDNDNCVELKSKGKKTKIKIKNNKQNSLSPVEIYDDAQAIEMSNTNQIQNERMSMTYDDIQTIVNDARKDIVKETRKKSFLDRVRYKKESPKKDELKKKSKQHKFDSNKEIIQSQSGTSQELLSYDDVIGLGISIKQNNDDDMGNYTCPPPPRAIYVQPPSIIISNVQDENEDFYDDIGAFQQNKDEINVNNSSQDSKVESSCPMKEGNLSRIPINLSRIPTTTVTPTNDQDECEHYQVPRPQEPIDIKGQVEVTASITEEIYDDIAIAANFRACQRDSSCSNTSSIDTVQSSTTNVVRVWNRFASGRKFKTNDLSPMDKNKGFNDQNSEMTVNSNEEIDGLKMNKFQKLINKMETSLSKTKPIPAVINKSHNGSNH